ncbi:hypothetical protein Pst134EA_031587 [Puccinia striiformis f. sp. tritici]|uniref:uncharacterized protein n=1 Tax=Puccinia striiformis f. sp. tritici TaxID=168172 RepID=UPI00200801C6|nr:uncharacterized protein Pst134EA_031587 [Puccinia striiformis f. sp. tritici]KAH9442739.1 hypothetical protein Pst134EA_031587 [Puccinia striiformis f. sp. tritici]
MKDAGEAGTGAKDVKNAHNLASKPGLQGGRSATSSLEKRCQRIIKSSFNDVSLSPIPTRRKADKPWKNTLPAKTPIAPQTLRAETNLNGRSEGGQLQDGKENVESFKDPIENGSIQRSKIAS